MNLKNLLYARGASTERDFSGAMPLYSIFVLLICITQALSQLPDPTFPPETSPDALYTLLNNIYGNVPSMDQPLHNVGSPLILTPYIEEKKLQEARAAARVNSTYFLPDVESYSGYLTVNKKYNSNLFFWYFPVSGKNVEKTPWIVWIQGGPGATSLFGLFLEIGPYTVTENGTLEEMKYSWGKNHSLLFIDNPVGAGYSFTNDSRGYCTNQTTIGENLYDALQQFLTIFPELRKAPLTIAGESYGGKHVPSIGIQILWNRGKDEPINLQGLAIGNGWIDPLTMERYSYFVREIGVVDDQTADEIREYEKKVVKSINNGNMLEAFKNYDRVLSLIMAHSYLMSYVNFIQEEDNISGIPWMGFVQRPHIRRAIHVGNTTFSRLNLVAYEKLKHDLMNSSKRWLEELLDNYKVLLYNGHLDIIVAYHPSVNTYNSLSFSGAAQFKNCTRLPWAHDRILAGYYRVAANLTEVMVRGAGHLVPIDKPAAALGLITAFTHNITLKRDTGRLVPHYYN